MAREPVAVDFLGLGTSMRERETELKAEEERGKLVKPTGSLPSGAEQSSAGDDEHVTSRPLLALGTDRSHLSGPLAFSLAQTVPWASMAEKTEEMERSGLAVPAAMEKQVEELSDADIMQLSGDECRRYMMMIKKERAFVNSDPNPKVTKPSVLKSGKFAIKIRRTPAGLPTSKPWFRMETRNEEEKLRSKRGGSAIKGVLLEASNLSAQSGPAFQHNIAGTSTISGPRNALPWHSVQSQPSLGEEVHVGASPSERAVASPLIPNNQEQPLSQTSGFGSPLPTYLRTLRTTEHSQRPSQASQPKQGSGAQLGVSPRPTGQTHLPGRPPTAQLTIFYSGMVNVYDGVSADKAQAIMLLAGSGSSWSSSSMNPPPSPAVAVLPSTGGMASSSNSPAHSGPTPVVASVSQAGPVTSPLVSTISVAAGLQQGAGRPTLHAELPQARKASLARFLEKRKDRVRGKAPYVPPIFSVKKDVGSSTPPREKSSSPKNSNSFTRSPSPANNLPRMNMVASNRTSSPAHRPETSPPKTQIVALQHPHASSSEDQASTSATHRPSPEDLMDWRSQQRPQLSSQELKPKAMAEDSGSQSQLQ